jgi:hypothetical protein
VDRAAASWDTKGRSLRLWWWKALPTVADAQANCGALHKGHRHGAGGAETGPANFCLPGRKDHGAQRSGPRPENEVFAVLGRTGTRHCPVAILATRRSQPVSLASPSPTAVPPPTWTGLAFPASSTVEGAPSLSSVCGDLLAPPPLASRRRVIVFGTLLLMRVGFYNLPIEAPEAVTAVANKLAVRGCVLW